MAKKDLNSFISAATTAGIGVVTVRETVHRDGELAAIVKLAEGKGNPLLHFQSGEDSELTAVTGQYACRKHIALALSEAENKAVLHFLTSPPSCPRDRQPRRR